MSEPNDRVSGRRARGARRTVVARGLRGALGALMLTLALSPALAELRVLLEFDAAGHRVHRVFRVPTPAVPPAASAARGAGAASLLWLDASGRTIARGRAPDPRVAHVPAPGGRGADLVAAGRVVLERGAWVARGPDAAATLLLRLPARLDLALGSGEWRLPLETSDR